MLYIYLPALYYHGNLYVTERVYPGGLSFPRSQRSFLLVLKCFISSPSSRLSRLHGDSHNDLL